MNALEQRIRGTIVASPLGNLLGAETLEVEPDVIKVGIPFRTEITTVGNLVHGGTISALVDIAGTAAAWSGVDPENPPSRGTTIGFNVSFLKGAFGKDLTATGRVVRRGKTICTIDVEVEGDEGELFAKALVTYKLG